MRKWADVTGDDFVDGLDVPAFVDVLLNGTVIFEDLCAADVTGDGIASDADVGPFAECVLEAGCP